MTDERYPIGKFASEQDASATRREVWLREMDEAPARVREAVAGLSDAQLDTPYRAGGWTVRQVVHHVPDSHMNGYIRTCLALTEHEPVIRPYEEQLWAGLPLSRSGDIAPALDLLEAVQSRWVGVLRAVTEEQWSRRFVHPVNGTTPLAVQLQLYAWHGRHHIAHITRLRERSGW